MAISPPNHIAIIGAGLSVMSPAIELHMRSIPHTIYELREPSFQTSGALMLSANVL
ncbi:hypothetical protein K432DRAFT_406224 [Lepidopterella palustris CBS 459.81]|uniref:Uncharacterized protein n=1 Tax=Lepidopterella palustris CBS 459.81 TaxID=1314670 RepID=A0A8E2E7F5_9PEZI|nr:hypothetical protein K432DRAFT_406224 [Lepidopterella palustris CBS 459.81]